MRNFRPNGASESGLLKTRADAIFFVAKDTQNSTLPVRGAQTGEIAGAAAVVVRILPP